MNREYSYIGKRVPKIDAYQKVTGSGIYGHDMKLPGMLHGKILRSEHPHARIVSIDTSAAEALPGVYSVLTGKSVNCGNLGFLKDQPALKHDKVRSLRDEVAAVAAITPEIAGEACRLIRVEYEPLPAVFDPLEAMEPGAPQLHDHAQGNRIPFKLDFETGDVDAAFKSCAHIVEGIYQTNFVAHCCMATCFAMAAFDSRGHLTMYSTTQIPYLMQNQLSGILKMPGALIRIVQPLIGGGFGAKLDVYPYEVIAALLAKDSGRPVRIIYSREEEFKYSPPRQPMRIYMRSGCDNKGRLLARDLDIILDNGAYTSWGATTPQIMLTGITSLYNVENVRFHAQSIYTCNPYCGAFRGYGNPQGTFANEQQMDELAELAGMDKLAFRLMNANQPDTETCQKFRITTCGLSECLNKAAGAIDFHGKKEPYEGVGIASMFHVGGGGRVYKSDACGVILRLDDFGRLSIQTGATEIGTGSDTAMAMIAAEELGIPMENINVINNDTDAGPWDVGIHASRTTFIAGNAVIDACKQIKAQLSAAAAKKLNTDNADFVFKNGLIISKSEPEKNIAVERVVRSLHFREKGEMVVGLGFYDPPNEFQGPDLFGNVSATYAFGTHAVRLKVDPDTGKVHILKFAAAHDVGKILNPHGLEGQLEGAIVQGLGYALTEQLLLEKGLPVNANFADYKLATPPDVPENIELIFVETNDKAGPYGAKGIGEAGLIPTAAAIANALYDALGIRFRDIPVTPEKILKAIHRA